MSIVKQHIPWHKTWLSVPIWAWALIGVLSLIEPVAHIYIQYASHPNDAVPSGLYNPDYVCFRHALRMFHNGFYSPFTTENAPLGTHNFRYFAVPFFLLYGIVGLLEPVLPMGEFLFLGVLNGTGALLYMLAVFRFLKKLTPDCAGLAFVLFSFRGGPGGLLYLAASATGLHQATWFEGVFMRFALCDLMEGHHLSAVSSMSRFYYTLPMAMGYEALSRMLRDTPGRHYAAGFGLLVLSTFFNMRLGMLFLFVGGLYIALQNGLRPTIKKSVAPALAVASGSLASILLIRMHPTFSTNQYELVRGALWFSPFVAAVSIQLICIPGPIQRAYVQASWWIRGIIGAVLGYLLAFTLLFLAYQTYYGNLIVCRDHVVSNYISDWALSGGCIGLLLGIFYAPRTDTQARHEARTERWSAVWFLTFFAISISAFGQGWFIRFVPQRLVAMMALPLCILCASAFMQWRKTRPRLYRTALCISLVCSGTTLLVSQLFFQGFPMLPPGQGPFAARRCQLMTRADGEVISQIPPGRILAPPSGGPIFADVISLQDGIRSLQGIGFFNFGDYPAPKMNEQAARFFSIQETAEYRKSFVQKWHIDYIFLPDTHPVSSALEDALTSQSWLSVRAQEGRAILLEVHHQ